jgi:hypothetical protein
MADSKLADLTAITSLGGDELLYVVDDPAGTPVDRKVTVADLRGSTGATVRKTADQTVNNSATLQNDSDLLLPVGANESWVGEAVIFATGDGAADIQFAITVPAGASVAYSLVSAGPTTANAAPVASMASGGALNGGTSGATARPFIINWSVGNGSTAGDIQIQWAQIVATVADTTVKAGSYIDGRLVG